MSKKELDKEGILDVLQGVCGNTMGKKKTLKGEN